MSSKVITLLGLAFLVILSGFNTVQSFITTLYPGYLGFISLTLLFIGYGVCSVVSPFILQYLSLKWVMFSSSLVYSLFVASVILRFQWLLLLSSVLVGFAAGLLWVSEGVYMTILILKSLSKSDLETLPPSTDDQQEECHDRSLQQDNYFNRSVESQDRNSIQNQSNQSIKSDSLDKEQTGHYHGYFYAFANSNGLIGSLISLISLLGGSSVNLMLYLMLLLCLIGSLLLLLIPNIKYGFLLYIINFTLLIISVLIPMDYYYAIYVNLSLNGLLFGLTDSLLCTLCSVCSTDFFNENETSSAFALFRGLHSIGFSISTVISAFVGGVELYRSSNNRYQWFIPIVILLFCTTITTVSAIRLDAIKDDQNRKTRNPTIAIVDSSKHTIIN
ncbi:hypothetical protein BC833DRAFT_380756 [Globomyces pollinis-pini]|nr:hypothetical protein BC833DRAFT_380756 [Globomyces pollinis-pini]